MSTSTSLFGYFNEILNAQDVTGYGSESWGYTGSTWIAVASSNVKINSFTWLVKTGNVPGSIGLRIGGADTYGGTSSTTLYTDTLSWSDTGGHWITVTSTPQTPITTNYRYIVISTNVLQTDAAKAISNSYPATIGNGLTYASGDLMTFAIETTVNTPEWYMDIDGFPVTMNCKINSFPFRGFDDNYALLDAWKLDINNEGFPWTWGWDKPGPLANHIYLKTADGLVSLTPYLKTADGFVPLLTYLKTSDGFTPL